MHRFSHARSVRRWRRKRGCAHEVERAVWRDERDGAVVLKARQAHALMELHVLQIHRLVLSATALRLKQHLPKAPSTEMYRTAFECAAVSDRDAELHVNMTRERDDQKHQSTACKPLQVRLPRHALRVWVAELVRAGSLSPSLHSGMPDRMVRAPPPLLGNWYWVVYARLVVEPELALGHARQEGAHLQRAHDLRAHYRAVAVNQQVDALHHIQKHLPQRHTWLAGWYVPSPWRRQPPCPKAFPDRPTDQNLTKEFVSAYCMLALGATSFFLYRMPSLRQDTALVTAMGGRACTCTRECQSLSHAHVHTRSRLKAYFLMCSVV